MEDRGTGAPVERNIFDSTHSTESIAWTAISLTHVEYPKGDLAGYVLAYTSLLPIFIGVGFVTLIIFRRDLHTMSYFCGLVVNEGINLVLKHVIQEHRPMRLREVLNTEYGMPSSHAQYMWFFAVYLIFFLFIRVHNNIAFVDNLWKYLVSAGTLVLAVIVGYSRVYLGYHTMLQVVLGGVIGAVLGVLWFCFVQLVLTPFFPVVTSWPVSEYLMLRDSTLIPNVFWFEYTSSRSEARNRQRKLTSRKSQ